MYIDTFDLHDLNVNLALCFKRLPKLAKRE